MSSDLGRATWLATHPIVLLPSTVSYTPTVKTTTTTSLCLLCFLFCHYSQSNPLSLAEAFERMYNFWQANPPPLTLPATR